MTQRRSIESEDPTQMQKALKETLNLFGGDTKEQLFLYLYNEYGVSVYDTDNLSKEKIEAAFSTMFGRGAAVLMEKFNSEMKVA